MNIEKLLLLAVDAAASDLHVLPGLPPLTRIDGELIPLSKQENLTPDRSKELMYQVMSLEQQEIFESDLVLEMAFSRPHIGNFRVSVYHQLHGVGGVFRIIPEKIPSFEELYLPSIFKKLLALTHGLILVTGPTGSGKSTTLAAMVDYINATRAANVITIEDPIEFTHHNKKSAINQLQVGRDTKNIDAALRAALRQDPDVILLGEMRDLETIRLALSAAETGHLVLATLHASSAPLTISRIIDVFSMNEKNRVRNLLSETVQAVVCQTLVKKIGGGRIAAFEIMLGSAAIKHLIRQDMISHMESTIQTSGDIGMCTMAQYLQELCSKQLISSVVAKSVPQHRTVQV